MALQRTKFKRFSRTKKGNKPISVCKLHPGTKFRVVGIELTGWLMYANVCRARIRIGSTGDMYTKAGIKPPTYLDISPNTEVLPLTINRGINHVPTIEREPLNDDTSIGETLPQEDRD